MNFDCGIYSIVGPGGKMYIGQTQSFKTRWLTHRTRLRSGLHHCKPLQNAWNKYGESSFIFAKIAIVPKDELTLREQEQIDSYINAGERRKLYNTSLYVAKPMRGIKGIDHPASLPVLCITTQKVFINGLAAAQWLRENGHPKADNSTISAACSGRRLRTAYGFRWGRPGDEDKPQAITIKNVRRGATHYAARSVVCIQTGMQFGTVSEAAQWLRNHGFPTASHRHISALCNGRRGQTAYGYQWKYAGDPDPGPVKGRPRGADNHKSRSILCIEEGIRFDLMSDAAEWLKNKGFAKAALSSLSLACSGKLKSAYGFHWKYAD
ncbi:GIY-YIG nuclease family protein [Paraburkholderia phenoliruptrix]|uniref:GIY-YIG nuclease family protein n=1 Tax=Paraburkholderia phenoliruptrix TaxID=252970 RepID=UPI002854AEDF|nr:GIY-YIG nuclease family protein [Paraburkholderia phenoliruptrix]MDR6389231.1 hypothetical protein [Paraburkholderia phenoliruptrix]